jgi:hypothetical protein
VGRERGQRRDQHHHEGRGADPGSPGHRPGRQRRARAGGESATAARSRTAPTTAPT